MFPPYDRHYHRYLPTDNTITRESRRGPQLLLSATSQELRVKLEAEHSPISTHRHQSNSALLHFALYSVPARSTESGARPPHVSPQPGNQGQKIRDKRACAFWSALKASSRLSILGASLFLIYRRPVLLRLDLDPLHLHLHASGLAYRSTNDGGRDSGANSEYD